MIDFEKIQTEGGPLVIRVVGKLDSATNEYFFECVKDEIEAGSKKIVLNFEGLGYVSSVGLGSLVKASSEATNSGGTIYLTNIENKLLDILRLVKFEKLFHIYDSEEEAIGALTS